MPDVRTERGPHPRDESAFAADALPRLEQATGELCWLLSRGYSHKAALKLVGDRHSLTSRQRRALQRCSAADEECRLRARRRIRPGDLRGKRIVLDGYNVLLTVEAALSGGVLLLGRDGTMRDMASMSRHYKRVRTTRQAIRTIGEFLARTGAAEVWWYLDRPISNSGRLRALLLEEAAENDWPWTVELHDNTDRRLIQCGEILASADSAVLDRCGAWVNLARLVVEGSVPDPWVVDLSGQSSSPDPVPG